MYKYLLLFSVVFFILACSNTEQKAYDNVNVISSDKNLNTFNSPIATVGFPKTVTFEKDLIIEMEDTDIQIAVTEGNTASFEFNSSESNEFNGTFYQGNGQIVIKERPVDTLLEIKKVLICKIPLKANIIVKSQYGSIDIANLNGTFKIDCPNGKVKIDNSSSSLSLKSQRGSFDIVNWQIMGRSKLHTSSGDISLSMEEDISYPLEIHSGSGNINLMMQGQGFNTNIEILSFKGNQNVFSEFKVDSLNEKYSHALDITYDRRVIHSNIGLPLTRVSTGNGEIQLKK